jgi:hypothetical protein
MNDLDILYKVQILLNFKYPWIQNGWECSYDISENDIRNKIIK